MYEERAMAVIMPMTFARAYINYVGAGHPEPKFAERILAVIGEMQVADVDDTVMVDLVKKLFPADAKAGYKNRHLYTPVIAILRMASKTKACAAPNLTRPKGYRKSPRAKIPPTDWFPVVLKELNPDARALVAFLTVHGRRIGDGFEATPEHFNPVARTLMIDDDKTGEKVQVDLHPEVAALIDQMPGWRQRDYLFRYGPGSHNAIYKVLRLACGRAKVAYFSPHKLGRHSFASRLLAAGYSLQYVKEAGGWKTISIVADLYGHLEQREVTRAVHEVGTTFMQQIHSGAKEGEST
jgi:integrase